MLSKKDEVILEILKRDCKLSTREIGDRIKIPVTTVHNRIKKMEKDGIIRNYIAVPDNKKIGKAIHAVISITVNYSSNSGNQTFQEDLAKTLYQMPEVDQCYIMTGSRDIILHILVKDIEELNNFVIKKLRGVEGIENTETSIVLSDVSENASKPFLHSGL